MWVYWPCSKRAVLALAEIPVNISCALWEWTVSSYHEMSSLVWSQKA